MMRGDMLHYLSELTAREAAGLVTPKLSDAIAEKEQRCAEFVNPPLPLSTSSKTGNAHQRASLSQARDVFSSWIRIKRVS